jgi:hypothetical protein
MDTSSFLSTLDDSLNIEFDLLKISEETNTICAHKNYQEFKKYVLQINGLSNFDSSEYHEYIVTTENNGWSAIQLYGKKSFRSEKVWFMNSFVFFDNVYFQIDITDSKKDLQTLKKETEEIFRHLLIEKTT